MEQHLGISSAGYIAIVGTKSLQDKKQALEASLKQFESCGCYNMLHFVFYDLGCVAFAQGHLDEAMQHYTSALQIQLDIFGEENEKTAETYLRIGQIYGQQEDVGWKKTIAFHLKALNIQLVVRQSCGDRGLAQTYSSLASFLIDQGKLAEPVNIFKNALSLKLRIYGGEDHSAIAHEYNNIAMLLSERGRSEDADKLLAKALEIESRSNEPDPLLIAVVLYNQAVRSSEVGDFQRAMDLFQKAQAINLDVFDEMHPRTAKVYHHIAKTHHLLGNLEEAIAVNTQSLKIHRRTLGDDHTSTERVMTLHRQWLEELLSNRT